MNNGFVLEGWSISSPSVREKLRQRSGCQEELRHRNCTRSLLDDVSPRAGSRSILEERECSETASGGGEEEVLPSFVIWSIFRGKSGTRGDFVVNEEIIQK